MAIQKEVREKMEETSSLILYEDGSFMVGVRKGTAVDEHHVLFNGEYMILQRGILQEFAIADPAKIDDFLQREGEHILRELDKEGLTVKEFGWILAKARIAELEDYATFLSNR
ncbi:MAG: hypothetical protein HGB03_00005 [Candidatus Yonathbacteria bacterium]|nr:hypothetical protein [Candidatus Yonathbacteria bacterium]NTW48063.1 hypothetical protein [Candidatus Yonathbacteria bacterium]